MRKFSNILIVSLFLFVQCLFVLSSCQDKKLGVRIYSFDTIELDYQQKKGLDSLESYLPLVSKMTKDERFAFELRYNLSRAKNYLFLPEDTVIKKYIAYFSEKKDTKRLLESYLLSAYAYSDLRDYEQAHVSIKAGITNPDVANYPSILARLYSALGGVFRQSHLDSLAYVAYKKAHKLYEEANDSILLAYSYKDLAFMPLKQGESYSTALSYLNKALERAKKNNDSQRLDGVIPLVAHVYFQQGKIKEAEKVLNQFSSEGNFKHVNKYMALARYYGATGDFDKLQIYCDSLINSGRLDGLVQGHRRMFEAYAKQRQYKEAYNHLYEFTYYRDSLKNHKRDEKLFQIESKYQNKLLRSKNDLLEAKNTATMRGVWALISIFLIVSAIAYIWYSNYIRRITAEARRKERRQKSLYSRSLEHIENMKQEIEALQTQLQEPSDASGSAKQEDVIGQQELLEARIQKAEMDRAARATLEKKLREMDVYIKMVNIGNCVSQESLSEEEWVQLEHGFEHTYDNLLFTLREVGRINKDETRLCCLVKLDVSNKGISVLLDKAPTTVSTMKQRAYKKITDKDGTANDFYEFIAGL